MEWKASGISCIQVGGRYVPLKTLWLKDRWGQKKRFRVKTVLDLRNSKHGFLLPWSQLARDEKGRIGALIVGAHHSGWLRIGSSRKFLPYLFVSLDALARKVRKKLLVPLDYELIEEEDSILAREKEICSYYIASKRSNLFHEPGCWQAKRIKDKYRIVFRTRKEALSSGYIPHKICGG
ncbi:hypothetical protein IBX65_05390 [Candidatus Aerophobetes bacterium]|nr:hypothetical protein [Candidatus Aerophobetes bacterium]